MLQALWKLGKQAAKDIPTTVAGITAIAAYFAGLDEILLLLLLGIVVMLLKNWQRRGTTTGAFLLPFSGVSKPLAYSQNNCFLFRDGESWRATSPDCFNNSCPSPLNSIFA